MWIADNWNDYEVIDFDDYAFQLYCIENFDLNKDGQIQYFEVKNVEGSHMASLFRCWLVTTAGRGCCGGGFRYPAS